jgi:hypothetical protein
MQPVRAQLPAFRHSFAAARVPFGNLVPLWAALFAGILSAAATGYWVTLPAVLLLWAAWKYLETEEGPPVFALAFTSLLGPGYGPEGDTCTDWTLDYTMRRFGDRWLIDRVVGHPGGTAQRPCR